MSDIEVRRSPETSLGERILIARFEASALRSEKLSQERLGALVSRELSKGAPVTAATVSRWESGDTVPSVTTIAAIARVCGVDPGWLAFGAASTAPSPRRGKPQHPAESVAGDEPRPERPDELRRDEPALDPQSWLKRQQRLHQTRLAKLNADLKDAYRASPSVARASKIRHLTAELRHLDQWLDRAKEAADASARLARDGSPTRSPRELMLERTGEATE
ncbi:MAG: helix-turn-helix domain-containing protein [Gemmatimonadales bacterium]